ncbi:shootin-1 [Anaeramoeba flamelloides]|uniref:Shootin-1 n=1 Tax=Anaeramoeba flamelloides TaxID=1746091 RepID=A0AAV7ZBD9_9EUKA|nr:shootin-1 [Anaeramoeba flamelloides]KAJ6251644.1 shootin-1 [Anaeramoeba flamelloides]
MYFPQNEEEQTDNTSDSSMSIVTPLSPWDIDPFDLDEELERLEKEKMQQPENQIEDLKDRITTLKEEKDQLNLFIKKILSENRRLKKKLTKNVVY